MNDEEFSSYLKRCNLDSRIVLYDSLGGHMVNQMNMGLIFGKRLSIMGSTLRSRTHQYKADLITDFSHEVLPFFGPEVTERNGQKVTLRENPTFKVNHDHTFKFDDVVDAHEMMEQSQNAGKILLEF